MAGIVGPGGMFVATDEGNHFTIRPPATSNDLHSLNCVGHTLGWAAGATIDGGATWAVRAVPTLATLRGISFGNAQQGIAAGERGTLISSGDGGRTWSAVNSPVSSDFYAAYFSRSSSVAWAVGAGGTIVRSTDAGLTFSVVRSGGPTLRAIRFAEDGLRGYAVGEAGVMLATSDVGATWRALPTARADLRGVAVSEGGDRIIAVGASGLVIRSIDSGASWFEVASGTTRNLNSIGFLDENPALGWAVGEGGTILSTGDAGGHFTQVDSPVAVDLESVEDL